MNIWLRFDRIFGYKRFEHFVITNRFWHAEMSPCVDVAHEMLIFHTIKEIVANKYARCPLFCPTNC